MSSITFTPSSVSQLYYISRDAEGITHRVAYLLPRTTPAQKTFGLQQSWTNYPAGCYIFLAKALNAEPNAENTFTLSTWNFLEDRNNQGIRFAWFDDPTNINLGLNNVSLPIYSPDSGIYHTAKAITFSLRNFQVLIGRDCQVTIGSDSTSFIITEPADQNSSLVLQVSSADTQLITTLSDTSRSLSIPLCGPQSGCLQFPLTLHNDAQTTHFDALDIGLRLFYQDPSFPPSGESFFVTSQRYPIFTAAEQPTLPLWANLDPLNHLDSSRTFFSFTPSVAQPTTTPAIPTHYRTNLGHKVALTPQSDAKLVMAIKTAASMENGGEALYLVPQGSFAIAVADQANTQPVNLMCGLSGVEYIKLPSGSAGLVRFIPGKGAYAPSFTPDKASTNTNEGLIAQAGTATSTTAWTYLTTADDHLPIYAAQPEKSVLHQSAAGNAYLEYMEVPSAYLTAPSADEPPHSFPLLPYAGLADSFALSDQLEREVVSSTRRYHISQIPPPRVPSIASLAVTDTQAGPTGVTPQGLLAEFTSDFSAYKSLTLATSRPYTDPQTSETIPQQSLQLSTIANTDPLWTALQTNQLFLVISDSGKISSYLTAAHISIENWIFDLSPANWSTHPEHKTILIFKFYKLPLRQLVGNSSQWSMPTVFNSSVGSIQQSITTIINDADDAITKAETQNYQKFVDAISDANWNGILVLNCSVPPDGLPNDLKGLSFGIDNDKFYAHHLGIEISPVKHDISGAVSIGYSALFGLIDYHDAAPPPSNSSSYNYKMTTLSILFENSRVKNFASQIQLTMDALFGEATKLLNSTSGNILTLDGHYESHDGHSSYTFSFKGDNVFALPSSQVFNAVEILKAQVSTTLPDPLPAGAIVRTRFSFWCNLNFKALKEADVLSFGGESGLTGGLSTANLGVDMTFEWQKDNPPSFAFDASHMTFDPAHSQFRSKSMYGHFPLKLTGLVEGLNDKIPADLGYMRVSSPLNVGNLSYPWYGLIYELDLGSVGALAGKIGLTWSMIVAWSPNPNNYQVYLGLKLPGSSSGKTEITIQGVIKIMFQRIIMIVNDPGDGTINYVLVLKNIQLKFLSLSLPPKGQTEIVIFGDSTATADSVRNTLGWYAAYAKQAVAKKPAPPDPFNIDSPPPPLVLPAPTHEEA